MVGGHIFHKPELKEMHDSKQDRLRAGWVVSMYVSTTGDLILTSVLDFQNFLRTQTGNTTTVNIIISTVDYLLRLQV